MKTAKRKRLKRAGWRFISAEEFLELSEEEQALVEIKIALAELSECSERNIICRRGLWQHK